MNAIMNKTMRFTKNQKGLTLIELLAIIVILGIIAAIAVPTVGNIIDRSKTNADNLTIEMIENAALLYLTDNDSTALRAATSLNVSTIKNGGYLKSGTLTSQSNTANTYTSVTYAHTSATGYSISSVNTSP